MIFVFLFWGLGGGPRLIFGCLLLVRPCFLGSKKVSLLPKLLNHRSYIFGIQMLDKIVANLHLHGSVFC